MDYEQERNLWELCNEQYDRLGMGGIERWIDNYTCPEEARKYLFVFREFMRLRNSTGLTKLTSLREYSSLRDFITHTFQLSQEKWVPSDVREYIRTRFEEIDFNTSHRQF